MPTFQTSISTTDSVRKALNTWKRREFKYGDADCCSFVAHVASELTGRDYRKFISYANEAEAYGIIKAHGGFEALMDSVFEHEGEPLNGDPCLLKLPLVGEVMGVKFGESVVCVTKSGLTQVKDRYIIKGWNLCHR